jgi:putative membrane protein
MHWYAGWQAGWFWGMHLVWWVLWVAVIVGVWTIIARAASGSGPRAGEPPVDVLRRRYAEGALTTAEFEERLAKLGDRVGPAR